MNKELSNLTIIILTFCTDLKILIKCIKSIEGSVKIVIVENSKKFAHKEEILKINSKIDIVCTGENLGYGGGNNFGLNLTKTDYALILNPDVICKDDYFQNLTQYINQEIDFSIIGSQYHDNEQHKPFGFFNKKKDLDKEKKLYMPDLDVADWVVGCSLLINLKKFQTKKLFDENFFLFFEEFDLCEKIKKKGGNVYSSKKLIIDHLGFKSSFASDKNFEIEALKLRNWHWMWSYFYYHKKNDGFVYALMKIYGKLLRSTFKFLYFSLISNKIEKTRYLYRVLGIINSIVGNKSWYRINF